MFKFKKSKIKIMAKPKEKIFKNPVANFNKMPSITSLEIKKNKSILVEALKNSSKNDTINLTQEAFLPKIIKRGKSKNNKEIVYKPEVIFLNEFVELLDKKSIQKEDQNFTNLNAGNIKNVTLNQVSRLIDLHYTLKKHVMSLSNREIYKHYSIDAQTNILIKRSMKSLVARNFKDLYDSNNLTFSKNLVDKFKQNNASYKNVDKDFLLITAIQIVNQDIAKKIVKYLAEVYDSKESIEDAISIQDKKPRPSLKSFDANKIGLFNSKASKVKNLKFEKSTQRKSMPGLNLSKRVLSSGRTSANPTKRNFSKNVFDNNTFDCNFKNYLYLLSKLEGLCNFRETVDNFNNANVGKENDMPIYDGNLSKSLENLKKLSFSGCLHPENRSAGTSQESLVTGANLENIINRINSGTGSDSLDELISAICYDQVAGANLKVNSQRDELLETKGKIINLFQDYFSDVFYKINSTNGVQKNLDFESLMKILKENNNTNQIGSFLKVLFSIKTSSKGEPYIPLENNETIAAKEYENIDAMPGEEIFFTEALKNNDVNLKDIKEFSNLFSRKTENIVEDITKILSLDFDEEGNSDAPEDLLINNLNPITYLNYYLGILGEDLESTYNDHERAEKAAFGLALTINSGDSFAYLADSFKTTLNGVLLNTQLGTAALWTSNPTLAESNKMESIAATLYSEAESGTEKLFIRLLENQMKVTGLASNTNDFPRQNGSYRNPLTTTELDIAASGIGNLNNAKKHNVTEIDISLNTPLQSSGGGVLGIINSATAAANDALNNEDFYKFNYGSSTSADVTLTENLNLKVTNEWVSGLASVARAVILTAAVIVTGGVAGFVATLGSTLTASAAAASASFIAATLGVSAAAAGGLQLIGNAARFISEEESDASKPAGAQITSGGFYTLSTITNGVFNKNITSNNLTLPSISSEESLLVHTGETHEYFSDEYGKDGSFDFKENSNPNNFGGIFKTNSIQRGLIFHLLAISLLRRTQDISVYIQEKKLVVSISKDRMKGLIYALQGKTPSPNAHPSTKDSYNIAISRINNIKGKILERQTKILDCLAVIKKHSDRLEDAYEDFKSLLNQEDDNIDFKAAKNFLLSNDYYNSSIYGLNYYFRDNILKNYLYNFAEENNSSELFLKSEKHQYRDIKIMKKILSTPGNGFLKNEGNGKKQIFHIGIPAGTINYLKKETYKKTSNEDYLDSNLVCIRVTKVDHIRNDVNYLPKYYVFDASKHVMPFYINSYGSTITSNHVLKYHDLMNKKSLIDNIELLVFDERENFGYVSAGKGIKGLVNNINSDTADNYKSNEFKQEVLENLIHDYYLKKYTEMTLGIEIGEHIFLSNTEKEYYGNLSSDNLVLQRNKVIASLEKNLKDTNSQEEIIFRITNSISNALVFSSNDRLKTFHCTPEFDKVFTMLISENDFLPNVSKQNIEKIFKKSPIVSLGSKLQNTFQKTDIDKIDNKQVKTFLKSNKKGSTNMSGYVFDIGLLPKW